MILETLGLAARIFFEVLPDLIGALDFPGRSKYCDYLDTVPTGAAPLPKREWRAAGRPERHTSAESGVTKAQGYS